MKKDKLLLLKKLNDNDIESVTEQDAAEKQIENAKEHYLKRQARAFEEIEKED